jgi:hypothetical protein
VLETVSDSCANIWNSSLTYAGEADKKKLWCISGSGIEKHLNKGAVAQFNIGSVRQCDDEIMRRGDRKTVGQ